MNDNEKMNKRLAEFMGLCWHDEVNNLSSCPKCGQVPNFHINIGGALNPDYASPDSPRRLLDEVEAKAIAEVGLQKYGLALQPVINSWTCDWSDCARFATATPEQRCRAICAVLEGK